MSLRQLSFYSVFIASMVALAACSEEDGEKYCGTDLNTQINATIAAAQAIEANAALIAAQTAEACADIAESLGVVPGDPTDVQSACAAADQAIAAELEGGVSITIVASPPVCAIDAQAQIDCEAGCTIDGTCEPGTIETRCEPGHFSVQCEGACDVDASVVCVAEASAAIACEGSCNGICNGECDGVCEGETGGGGACEGTCSGTCSGTCEGSCEYEAEGFVECDANATVRCRGGCDGSASLPRCETELTPPSCDLEADCQASCKAEGSFKASCEPGRVHVVIDGGDGAALAAALEANLPRLLAVVDGYVALWGDVSVFADDVANLSDALQDNLLCLGARLNSLLGAIESAGNAAANVTVTVEFSACVSASTGNDGAPACGD